MSLQLHTLPYTKGHYIMGEQHYLWSYLIDFLATKNYGIQDLQPMKPAHFDTMAQKFYFMGHEHQRSCCKGCSPRGRRTTT